MRLGANTGDGLPGDKYVCVCVCVIHFKGKTCTQNGFYYFAICLALELKVLNFPFTTSGSLFFPSFTETKAVRGSLIYWFILCPEVMRDYCQH